MVRGLIDAVALVLPLPNPNDPTQHEACCPLCKEPMMMKLNTKLQNKQINTKCKLLYHCTEEHKQNLFLSYKNNVK